MHSELFSIPLGLWQIINKILCLPIVFSHHSLQPDSVVLLLMGPCFYHIYSNGGSFYHVYSNDGALYGSICHNCFHRLLENVSVKWKKSSFFFTLNKIYSLLLPTKRKIVFDYLKMTELPALKIHLPRIWLRRFRRSMLSVLKAHTHSGFEALRVKGLVLFP